MLNLFEGATSQYVDDNGKGRMLNYEREKLSLMISPIPPLNLPLNRTVFETNYATAKKFMARKELKVSSQDGSEASGKIWGLWVDAGASSPIYYAYIPLVESPALPDVPFSDPTKNDPIRTEPAELSDLRRYQRDRKTADFLRRYTLYAYSLNPDKFGPESFIIIPKYTYLIENLNKRLFFQGNQIMFRNGKLIVPSEKIRDHLLAYLDVSLLNDRQGVLDLKNEHSLDVFYQSISDFRPAPNQLVFLSRDAVHRWKREVARSVEAMRMQDNLDSETAEPYYYRNIRFEQNAPCIVQNVRDGELQRAVVVSTNWLNDRVNTGYRTGIPDDIDELSYTIYYTTGETETHKKTNDVVAPIVAYDDGTFGALLFIY